ncbi:Tyrosine-protein kinase [Trema orientale]|uniref:Tyrosine-protein kinase n=1 Tax=Trema orientale TaxID=63057 RepID=A0A2P5ECC4_TREOI|nr:Tyrosine-protein kinase [Trema orientale]
MFAIYFSDPPTLPEGVFDEFRSFVERCLQKESSKRWSATQLLAHPFLCQISKIRLIFEVFYGSKPEMCSRMPDWISQSFELFFYQQ